jgi:glycosyltransferase involved in cell wall biosynthesis
VIRRAGFLEKLIKSKKPAWVHIHTAGDYWLSLVKVCCQETRFVITRHNGLPLNWFPNNLFLNQCDLITTPSQDSANRLIAKFPNLHKKTSVVYHASKKSVGDSRTFRDLDSPDKKEIVLGFAGRITKEKGLHLLLKALQLLKEKHGMSVRTIVAGYFANARYQKEIEQLTHGLAGQVEFLGFQPDMRGFYQAVDILVQPSLPSWIEAFGLTALEAMEQGVPVVAFRSGALPEVIGDAGWVVNSCDPPSLAAVILKIALMSNSQRSAFSEWAKKRAETIFSEANLKQRLNELFNLAPT